MKKIQTHILSFFMICTILFLPSLLVDAKEVSQSALCKCDSDLSIYEEPDENSEILEQRARGEAIYVISRKGQWATVFCNGVEGYVFSRYIVPMDNEKLAEDSAFDDEALIKEYGNSLEEVYRIEMEGKRVKKIFVIACAVAAVIVFAVIDTNIKKKRVKKRVKKMKRKEHSC